MPPALVFRWAVAGTAGVLLTFLVAYCFYVTRGILVLVLMAIFVAVSLDPVIRWLVARAVPRPWAVTIVVFALVAVFGVFVWSVVPPVAEQGSALFGDLPGHLQRLSRQSHTVREFTNRYHLTAGLTSLAADLPGRLAGGAVGFALKFLGALGSALTVLVLAIYFMADMRRLRHGLVGLFPPRRRTRVAEIVDVVVHKVGGYMIGNILVSLLAGLASFVCLELVGVPFALPLSVVVAITDLIPMIGATLGAAICLVVTVLTVGVWPAGIIVLIFFIAYQQVENYLIVPRVMRGTLDMPSMVVLVVSLLGGAMLGLVGVIMAIPTAAAVKVVITPTIAKKRADSEEAPPGD
ncbi:AI-2E family transporter [Actinopolymorpha sp. NPDC004070]|uniref:AI-2E family transporter n=1 Tax=Actinopolymorpha sp. NPDC004070 TaxID=3154548 RepID=UPI0033ACCA24